MDGHVKVNIAIGNGGLFIEKLNSKGDTISGYGVRFDEIREIHVLNVRTPSISIEYIGGTMRKIESVWSSDEFKSMVALLMTKFKNSKLSERIERTV